MSRKINEVAGAILVDHAYTFQAMQVMWGQNSKRAGDIVALKNTLVVLSRMAHGNGTDEDIKAIRAYMDQGPGAIHDAEQVGGREAWEKVRQMARSEHQGMAFERVVGDLFSRLAELLSPNLEIPWAQRVDNANEPLPLYRFRKIVREVNDVFSGDISWAIGALRNNATDPNAQQAAKGLEEFLGGLNNISNGNYAGLTEAQDKALREPNPIFRNALTVLLNAGHYFSGGKTPSVSVALAQYVKNVFPKMHAIMGAAPDLRTAIYEQLNLSRAAGQTP